MYRRYLSIRTEPFHETPGGAGGGTATLTADQVLANIKKLDELPGHLKEQVNALVQSRVNQTREDALRQSGMSAEEKAELDKFRKSEAERKQKELEEKGHYEAVLKSKDEAFAAERVQFNEKLTTVTSRLRTTMVDREIIAAASENQAHNPKQLATLLRDRIRLTDKYDVEVLDESGNMALKAGHNLTVAELVAQYLDENPHLRKASGTGGSGSKGGQSTDPEGAAASGGLTADVAAKLKTWQDATAKAADTREPADVTAAHRAKRAYEQAVKDAKAQK